MTADSSVSVVAVTGASGFIGFRFLQELEAMDTLDKLVAIDRKPLPRPLHNIHSHRLDVSRPLARAFQRDSVDTVVHLAFNLQEGHTPAEAEAIQKDNLLGLENLLKESLRARVKAIIYLSSHTVYGAYPDNPIPITEERGTRPLPNFQYGQTKFRSEQLLSKFAEENPDVVVTILRCCMVMGPEGGSRVTQGFDQPALLKIAGADPPLQFIHNVDLARILAMLSTNPRPGTFNLAGKGVLRYSEVANIMGKRLVPLPSSFAYPVVDATWKFGAQKESTSIGLNFIRYPVIMATGKLRQTTGYKFRYTAREAVTAYAASNMLLQQKTAAVFSP